MAGLSTLGVDRLDAMQAGVRGIGSRRDLGVPPHRFTRQLGSV